MKGKQKFNWKAFVSEKVLRRERKQRTFLGNAERKRSEAACVKCKRTRHQIKKFDKPRRNHLMIRQSTKVVSIVSCWLYERLCFALANPPEPLVDSQ